MGLFDQITSTLTGKTDDEKKRDLEVENADKAQKNAVKEGGEGVAHDRIVMFDKQAHNVAAQIARMKLAPAQRFVDGVWKQLFQQHEGEEGSIAALQSLERQVITPVLTQMAGQAREELMQAAQAHADRYYGPNAVAPSGDENAHKPFRQWFFDILSPDVLGTERGELHPLALAVWERVKNLVPSPDEQEGQESQGEEHDGRQGDEQKQTGHRPQRRRSPRPHA